MTAPRVPPTIFAGGPCLGGYPHIGADANAVLLTTNEFSFFGPGFFGAQIYAISKRALASGAASVTAVLFNTGDPNIPFPGFTVWPAISPNGNYDTDNGGTEFLLSSLAVFSNDGTANQLVEWLVTNTSSLNSASPALALSGRYVNVATYGVPPRSNQKAGNFPQGQCLADNTIATPFGTGCWRYFFTSGGPFPNVEKEIDSKDSRMQQVHYANGKLWSALDSAVTVGGATKAGIAYYVINPNSGKIVPQGVVAVANNNVTYPAIAVDGTGRGVMAFTLEEAIIIPVRLIPPWTRRLALAGFTLRQKAWVRMMASPATTHTPLTEPDRAGETLGGAVYDGANFWIASEYVGQTCPLSEYLATGFSSGATRASLGNWATRISKLVE